MALAETGKAIGKVTQLLNDHLQNRTNIDVTVGKPEDAAKRKNTFNLFLYEALFDASLKNVTLDEGKPPPLWLVLKYLLTSFDKEGDSDSKEAHELLGEGIRVLQELSYLPLSTDTKIRSALEDNPEPLKITFDEVSSELLSKLMQGSDETYRFSIGFQVRPVMIATAEPPSYSLLVGVDYTKGSGEKDRIISTPQSNTNR